MPKQRVGLSGIRMLVLLFALAFAMPASAKQNDYGQVKTDETSFRMQPSVEGELIDKLDAGKLVEILETIDTGDVEPWYRAVCEGRTGYIRSDLIMVRQELDYIGYVNQDGVNLRGGPGTSSYIMAQLVAGHSVQIRQMVGDWYFVTYEGQEGFVKSNFIDATSRTGEGLGILLRRGMAGSEVLKMQNMLVKRNFLDKKNVDGEYGPKTQKAVTEFQKMAGIADDGSAGPQTLEMIYDSSISIRKPDPVTGTINALKGKVQTIDWWKGGNRVLKRPGGTATVWDVNTGKSFKIRRTAGTNHNDVVPLNAAETAKMKAICGSWSWQRRAIIVEVGGKAYAASMNCMPHSPDSQKNDNFPGHFCVHFTNSRTHGGNRVDPEHKAAIERAYSRFK